MKKPEAAIIDFGSEKITVLVGRSSQEGNLLITTRTESPYAGFADGELLEPDAVLQSLSRAVNAAEQESGLQIRDVYVGVPGEFTSVSTNETTLSFKTRKKITQEEMNMVYDYANKFGRSTKYTLMSRSPIYYQLDDGRAVVDPMNQMSSSLYGQVSYLFVENNFKNVVSMALKNLGMQRFEFLSGNLAEALFLIEPQVRDRCAILIDIGYITSSIMLVKGDGLLFLKSFSIGSGHIAADLSTVLEIGFDEAQKLLGKVNLNLDFDANDVYSVGKNYPAQKVNAIVEARVEDIAEKLKQCFSSCEMEFPQETPVFLTGGGLAYLKGGANALSGYLGRPVTLLTSDYNETKDPASASAYGVLDLAIKQVKKRPMSFWTKLFG